MLKKLSSEIVDLILTLQNAGYETYLVGGAVRDLLMGRAPKDYDVSTIATPEEVLAVFGRRRAMIIGKRFRLVHVRVGDDIVEVSTFRRMPGHEPRLSDLPDRLKSRMKLAPNMIFQDNEFGTPEEDALRRDFTVNALFFDPSSNTLLDYTHLGERDLKQGVIRMIGANPVLRFEEDPVRVLRALKLVGQYHFAFEPKTAEALCRSLHLIAHVPPSRLSLELEKIFRSPYGSDMLETCQQYGFLKFFLPYAAMHWNTEAGVIARAYMGEYSRRLRNGQFRDSASLAIAALALPFIETRYGYGMFGQLWEVTPEIKNVLFDMIDAVIQPHNFCAKIIQSAYSILVLQHAFYAFDGDLGSLVQNRSYTRARELFLIQQRVLFGNEAESAAAARFPAGHRGFFSAEEKAARDASFRSAPGRERRPSRRKRRPYSSAAGKKRREPLESDE